MIDIERSNIFMHLQAFYHSKPAMYGKDSGIKSRGYIPRLETREMTKPTVDPIPIIYRTRS